MVLDEYNTFQTRRWLQWKVLYGKQFGLRKGSKKDERIL